MSDNLPCGAGSSFLGESLIIDSSPDPRAMPLEAAGLLAFYRNSPLTPFLLREFLSPAEEDRCACPAVLEWPV